MALGLYEQDDASDIRDDRFLTNVQDWLGRDTTSEEEETAFACRDQQGYNAKEAAEEIRFMHCADAAECEAEMERNEC